MTLEAPRAAAAELEDRLGRAPVGDSEVVFAGRVWDVRRETVDLGQAGEVVREFVDHPGAVAVLALREDRGDPEVLLIQQYRHPIGAHEWELPAGLLDVAGEAPWVGAARELGEEADLRARTWHLLADYLSSPGGISEALRVYLARDLSDVPEGERFTREDEEQGMPTRWVRLDDAVDAVLAGRIRNATVAIGVLSARAGLDRGWETLRPVDTPWPAHPGLG
ncbi:NUDIX domain-containing protein [Ornithinicoccus hortensis]|uniref:ADP-ribose pyrophosphatase n=1 Tax=Ornithinicoccus hortensis TaxID=82346 RepID=A0A542YSD3_9MICO|nr:NUDIX hydrolase [Ornithinicoccus hortensis]TQL51005.1 ADP-ribose pyrophosphatase [Ornithinicoccus hortensis]